MHNQIIYNRAHCNICRQTITSTHRHDFVTCSCGNLSVDGGLDYLRRGFSHGKSSWDDESIQVKIGDSVPQQWYPTIIAGIREMLDYDRYLQNIEIIDTCSITYEGGNPMRRDIIAAIADKMFADCHRTHNRRHI